MQTDVEFWPLKVVVQKVGLSKTEVYRRAAEGKFPQSRGYGDGGVRRFWVSTEVQAWQQQILDAQ